MIAGTPTGTSGTFNFKVHVTDSGNPQLTSPDVQLSITIGTPPISIGISEPSAYVVLNGTKNFIATVSNDQQNGNVDWALSLNGVPCAASVCGSLSPATSASGLPITFTAPGSAPPANIILTATTIDGTPPATTSAAITITAHGFTATGSMVAGRSEHTATLLNDGRVLVAGGIGSNKSVLGTAELYDPTNGTFTSAGSMANPRRSQTATLLGNDKVLLTGGYDANGNRLASAEIFDPATGTFSTTGSMETARAGQTATLLADGKVLVAGGDAPPVAQGENPYGTAELYDLDTGVFTPTGNMENERVAATATLFKNGQVLVVGGGEFVVPNPPTRSRGVWVTTNVVELFDPTSGTFATTGSLQTGRWRHTATLQNDGTVLVTGGENSRFQQFGLPVSTVLSTSEVFNPANGAFAATGKMAAPRTGHSATLLSDGTTLLAGGTDGMNQHATTEIYESASGTFTRTGDIVTPRANHKATLLKDGAVLVTGGVDSTGNPIATTELYQ